LAHRQEAKADASGDSATFSVPLTAERVPLGRCRCCSRSSPTSPLPLSTRFTRRT
jgi:hypothetical protein